MITSIDIDEDLLKEAEKLTGIRTKKQLVHETLNTLVALKKRRSILELFGRIKFQEADSYKQARGE